MKLKIILLWLICIVSTGAHAGTTTGKVGNVFINAGNDIFSFSMASGTPNFAVCANQWLYSVTTSTQAGKNLYAAILSVKASGQTIQVVGANTCNVSPNSGEDVIYMAISQ
jgi:hypothetical protein